MLKYCLFVLFFCTFCFGFCYETVYDVQNAYFKINGVYFHYDKSHLMFPIELGDQFDVVEEKVHPLHKNAFYKTITILSPVNGCTQSFESIVMNHNKISKIIEVQENSRDVVKQMLPKNGFDPKNPEKIVILPDVPIWLMITRYTVVLDDTTSYSITIKTRTYHESKVPELLARQWIQSGDDIIWGEETTLGNSNTDVEHYNFYFSNIKRNGKEIDFNRHFSFPDDTIEIKGMKRKEEDKGNYFRVIDRGIINRLDRFGTNTKFLVTCNVNFGYGSNLPIPPGLDFWYEGFEYKEGKRVFIFSRPAGRGIFSGATYYFTPVK